MVKKITPRFLRLFTVLSFFIFTQNLTAQLLPANVPSEPQYHDASRKYIEYIPGNMPVIISAPHGGRLQPSELSTRNCGTNEMDDNTDILIREIQKWCYDQYGLYPHIIVNNLHRRKLDPNRNEDEATCGSNTKKIYYNAFHGFIDQASADVTTKYGKGLYIDLHGQSHQIPRIEAGYNLTNGFFDTNLNANSNALGRVTIKNLIETNIQNLTFESLVRGSESLGGLLQTTGGSEYASLGWAGCSRNEGYRTVPSHISSGSSQGSCDDTNPGNNTYFAGDFYNNIRHGSGDTTIFNSVSGASGNTNPNITGGGGTIDGIMTEVNRRVRDLGSVYSSAYGYSDSKNPTVPYFARDYATVIKDYIDLHYNNFSNFAYVNSTYDLSDASNPMPTITGISGGTFTASGSGLIINSSTGEINLAASTAGTYTITYLASNIESYYKKTTTITLTEMPDNASFSYPSSSVCKDEPNPTPIISGENGGNFSVVPGGLDFVSVTSGEIDLITSVSGTYTVTYTTTSPGQNSSTFEITINDLDNASFSYDSTSYPLSDPDPTPTLVGLAGGTYTSEPAGLDLDPSSGTITLMNSNTGNYIVTYTVIGSCNTVVTTQNVSVTGSVLDVTDEEFTVFSIYPNPTSDLLTIESNFNVTKIEVNNLLGQKIKEFTLNENKQIDLTKLKTGTYLITFFNENKKLGTRTVIKK